MAMVMFKNFFILSFAINKSLLEKHFLEGQTFEQAYKNDRLFYIDYKDLNGYIAKASKEVRLGKLWKWATEGCKGFKTFKDYEILLPDFNTF